MRSDNIKRLSKGPSPFTMFRACGVTDDDFEKPFIGIANSFTDIVPGHIHLRELVETVKVGISQAGGVPFEFNTMAICDGIAMNHRRNEIFPCFTGNNCRYGRKHGPGPQLRWFITYAYL